MAWIVAELHFGSLFSYRIPNISPSFALTSPIPSPAAIRLALVDTAIKIDGRVESGIEIFELVKKLPMEIEPPERVVILKFFIKRLKPSKNQDSSFEESFGIREYCHFYGPMKVYLQAEEESKRLEQIFRHLRRLGTSDSLLSCRTMVRAEGPDPRLIAKLLHEVKPEAENFTRRPVVSLNEIREDACFSQVNPYEKGRGNPFAQKTYILPLQEIKRGENFVIYRIAPFSV
ncbi:MAG: type I-A CRISPR-associated protein Cas5 [Candidatus Aminicenantes bacterium]|nr:type I-A CRISPR-associated protein Cas5 [Candidatus Aminicenantes bacterium]